MRMLMTIGLLFLALVCFELGFRTSAGVLLIAGAFCEIAMAMVAPSRWDLRTLFTKEKRLPK